MGAFCNTFFINIAYKGLKDMLAAAIQLIQLFSFLFRIKSSSPLAPSKLKSALMH